MLVATFGSNNESLVKVASAGAVKYKRQMNSKDQPTDCLAALTDDVVKYRIRTCGREAVPAIIQRTNVKNFQLAIADALASLMPTFRAASFPASACASAVGNNSLTPRSDSSS